MCKKILKHDISHHFNSSTRCTTNLIKIGYVRLRQSTGSGMAWHDIKWGSRQRESKVKRI